MNTWLTVYFDKKFLFFCGFFNAIEQGMELTKMAAFLIIILFKTVCIAISILALSTIYSYPSFSFMALHHIKSSTKEK